MVLSLAISHQDIVKVFGIGKYTRAGWSQYTVCCSSAWCLNALGGKFRISDVLECMRCHGVLHANIFWSSKLIPQPVPLYIPFEEIL